MKNRSRFRNSRFDELHDEGRIMSGGRIKPLPIEEDPSYQAFCRLPKDKPCPICHVLLNEHSPKKFSRCAVEYVDP